MIERAPTDLERSRAAAHSTPESAPADQAFRQGWLLAILSAAFLVAAVVAAVLAVLNTDRIVTVNMRAAQVRESVFRLESAYSDILAGEYAALLSDDPAAVDRFRNALEAVTPPLERLRELVMDQNQRERLGRIEQLVHGRVTEIRSVLALIEAGRRDEARDRIRSLGDAADQAAIRASLADFRDRNRLVLAQSEHGYRSAARIQMIVGGVAAFAILLFGLQQLLSTYRFLRQEADSRSRLSAANERLEREVAARTAELAGAVQRFEVALRAANVIVFTQDRNRVFTWISSDVFGLPSGRVIGFKEEDLLPPDVCAIIIPAKEAILSSGTARDYQYSVEIEGRPRWFRVKAEPLADANGRTIGLIGAIIDLTSEKATQDQLARVTDELRDTLQRFQVALKGADITVFAQDAKLLYTWVSREFDGRSPADFVGRTDAEVFKPELARRLTEMKTAVLTAGEPASGEFRVEGVSGENWQLVRVEPRRDSSGAILGILGASVDVTDRRTRETHNRILLRELTHRTKNLLAVVQAMARQTLTTSVSARDFESRFSGRLQGLASSLDILVNENWQGAAVVDLVQSQLTFWKDIIGTRIRLHGADVRLEPEAAQNIGLALHELSTNSAKYGALSVPGGLIDIAWSFEQTDPAQPGEARFSLSWRESNGPRVEPPRHKGFGHAVIERLVPRALNARAQLDYAPAGFSWRLDMPSSYTRAPDAEPREPKVWAG